MVRLAPLLLVVVLATLMATAAAHNSGLPHKEYTAQELQDLGLADLITSATPGATGASIATQSGNPPTATNWAVLSRTWVTDPAILATLAVAALLYGLGVARLWRTTHVGGGITVGDACWYSAGWISLALALVSPLHPWGEVLFSAHMTQHEILMLVSAPLMVLGRPLLAFMWALPRPARAAVGQWMNTRAGHGLWQLAINPAVAWLVHAVALWVWHIPSWFQATLHNDFIHSLQHASFFGSAILFWWALIYGHKRVLGYGMGIMYLFTTAVHSGALGALLIFTQGPWYPAYAGTAGYWGLTPMEDQQLGGLIMWVPAGVVYIVAALLMFIGWLRESERRVVAHQASWLAATAGPSAIDTGSRL